jgi:hypothetical protein
MRDIPSDFSLTDKVDRTDKAALRAPQTIGEITMIFETKKHIEAQGPQLDCERTRATLRGVPVQTPA